MRRRSFLKIAGITSTASSFLGGIHPALALTWQKIGGSTSSMGKVKLPTRVKSTNAKMTIACGSISSYAINSNGLLFSCGNNGSGQLGINSVANKSSFVSALNMSNIIAISKSGGGCLVLRSNGNIFGCGYNPTPVDDGYGGSTYGSVLGNGDGNYHQSNFGACVGVSNVIAMSNGSTHSIAIRSDGFVFTSGNGYFGQLGINLSGINTRTITFVQAIGISNAVAVTNGYDRSFALRSDGLVFGCGANSSSQLGMNTTVGKITFAQCLGISNASAISAGRYNVMALRSDGLVFTCGEYGTSLGNNSTSAKSTFTQAIGISNAVAIACGYKHSVALRSDGLVFSCGQNIAGQLGDNTTIDKSAFIQASGISNIVAISAGIEGSHTLALRSDGLLFACGFNGSGQLGDNSTANKSTFGQMLN